MENSVILLILNITSVFIAGFLTFITYRLLRKEYRKSNPRKTLIFGTASLFCILLVSLFLVVTEVNSQKNDLSVTFGSYKISLFNPHTTQKDISDAYFKNTDIGFAFLKPSKKWSRIKRGSGLIEFLKMSGLKTEEITPEKLAEYNNDPFLQIFNYVTFFSFNQSDFHLNLKFTDSTEVGYLKPYEKNYFEQTLDALNREYPNNLNNNLYWADSLTQAAMYRVLSNLDIDFSAQYKLIAFPKNAFNSGLNGLSLAGFYNVYSSSFGMNVSKLVANNNGILMGVNSLLENVVINKEPQDLEINRYTHFSESEDFVFVIEISHSPQSSPNSEQWNELSNVMESFLIN